MGAVDAQELTGWQQLLHALHGHQGHQRARLSCDIESQILAHRLHTDDVGKLHGHIAMVGAHEDGGLLQALAQTLQRLREVGETEGFQQVVHGIHLETFHSILGVGGGEDDERTALHDIVVGELAHEVHAAEVGHVDVAEDGVHRVLLQKLTGFQRALTLCCQFEEGYLINIGDDLLECQRFIVNSHASYHVSGMMSSTL